MTANVGVHVATVRQYDPGTGVATVVVPALYGDVAVEARPFVSTPDEIIALPAPAPNSTVIAFYDGGDTTSPLRWYRTGGGTVTSGGGGITTEDAVDAVAAALRPGTGVSVAYNDAANTITITNTGGVGGLDTEGVIDAVAAALTAGAGITISYDDPGGTITITSTSTGVDEVWVGPGTPPGAQEIWYDTDAVPTPAVPQIVVKSTAPTAADFGVASIPVDSIWVQKP